MHLSQIGKLTLVNIKSTQEIGKLTLVNIKSTQENNKAGI